LGFVNQALDSNRILFAIMAAVCIVLAAIGINSNVFTHSTTKNIIAAAWILLAVIDSLWVLYFSAEKETFIYNIFSRRPPKKATEGDHELEASMPTMKSLNGTVPHTEEHPPLGYTEDSRLMQRLNSSLPEAPSSGLPYVPEDDQDLEPPLPAFLRHAINKPPPSEPDSEQSSAPQFYLDTATEEDDTESNTPEAGSTIAAPSTHPDQATTSRMTEGRSSLRTGPLSAISVSTAKSYDLRAQALFDCQLLCPLFVVI
jgi:hypothetical protein